jgi:hypothetical protein
MRIQLYKNENSVIVTSRRRGDAEPQNEIGYLKIDFTSAT